MAVSKVEILKSTPYYNGEKFGAAGGYTELDLMVEFAIDPSDYAHQVITDLELCLNRDDLVTFSADAKLLIPEVANNRLILDVPNRGRNLILKMINNAPEASVTSSGWEPGNGFLLDQGYTLTWCGWQHDVPPGPNLLNIRGPQPKSANAPIQGLITMTIQTNSQTKEHLLSERGHAPLPAADTREPSAILTVQENETSEPETIDRSLWAFGKENNNSFVPDPSYVYLETGFQPGYIYRVTYTATNPIANGIGLIATRDWVSYLRSNPIELNCPEFDVVYGFGHSQSGRFLRHFIYLGLNLDSNQNIVFDGIIAHAAGARRGEFNQRFAQPSSAIKQSKSNMPPFTSTSPYDKSNESLLQTQNQRGGMPKIFLINTASEYWWAHASLSHTTQNGEKDLEPADNCRMYFYSGTQHSSGKFPLTNSDPSNGTRSEEFFNFVDYRPALRGLFVRLSEWVENDTIPPSNKIPRIDDGSLIPYSTMLKTYQESGIIPQPAHIKQIALMEFSENPEDVQNVPVTWGAPLPVLVPAVNESFNEYSGITLPEVQVPLGIHLGWNLRHADIGGHGQIIGTIGSTIVSSENLPNKTDYLNNIEASFNSLLDEGFVLELDRDYIIQEASIHYDAISSIGNHTT